MLGLISYDQGKEAALVMELREKQDAAGSAEKLRLSEPPVTLCQKPCILAAKSSIPETAPLLKHGQQSKLCFAEPTQKKRRI